MGPQGRWILLGILAAALAFATGSNAQIPTQIPSQTAASQGALQPAGQPTADLLQVETEAVNWLQDLIRINTTNPPGNELVAAKYLAGVLNKEGIQSETFESTPGRGFLVARLASSAVPDPSKALLLMGHLDVVGVDRSKWTVDPFGGAINGGYLYGRGTIDDKGMTAANLAVMVMLKRSGVKLNRDVIFLAEGDEEDSGATGIQFAIDKHWDKIAAGFALNEGGEIPLKDGKPQYVGVQVSEKAMANIDVIATGTSGHASIPLKDNPIAHLSAAIAKISAYEAPVTFDSVTRAYFDAIAPTQDEDTAKWMKALESGDRGEHAVRFVADANPMWNAMMRDTVSPTMEQAGVRANVIPAEARAVLNVRVLPSHMIDPLFAKLQALVNDPKVKLVIEGNRNPPAPSSSLESDLYTSITRASGKVFPGAPVAPYLSTWATDSSFLRIRNVQCYGLVPFPMTDADLARMHGNDERVPVDAFRKGVEFIYSIVSDFAVER